MRFGVILPTPGTLIRLFNGTGDTAFGDEDKDSVCIWFVVCWSKENIVNILHVISYQTIKKILNRKYIRNFLGGSANAEQLNVYHIFLFRMKFKIFHHKLSFKPSSKLLNREYATVWSLASILIPFWIRHLGPKPQITAFLFGQHLTACIPNY